MSVTAEQVRDELGCSERAAYEHLRRATGREPGARGGEPMSARRAKRERRKREIEVERERRGSLTATAAIMALDGQFDRRATLFRVREVRARINFHCDRLALRMVPGCARFADSLEVIALAAELRARAAKPDDTRRPDDEDSDARRTEAAGT